MKRDFVTSSDVRAIGYDQATETLEVEFLSGGIYQYYGFPQNMYDQFMQSVSKGKFFHTYIKNQYASSRTG
jgi:KTSC domain